MAPAISSNGTTTDSSSAGAAYQPASSSDVAADSSKQGDGNTSSSGSGADAGSSSTAGVQQPGSASVRKTGLMSEFKWGCPDNVEEVSAACTVRYSCDSSNYGPKNALLGYCNCSLLKLSACDTREEEISTGHTIWLG
jgi:hypothetical protein